MHKSFAVIKIMFKRFPFINAVMVLIMSAVLFFANMFVCEYSLSDNELSCYKTLAKQNIAIIETADATFDFNDEHIVKIFPYQSLKSVVNGDTVTVQYYSANYLSELDVGVNRGRWFDGKPGKCVVVNSNAVIGETLHVNGRNYTVIGTINKSEYFPVMNVYKGIPVRNLSLLWNNDSIVPNVIISENSSSIVNPTHYIVQTSSPISTLTSFDTIRYLELKSLYDQSYKSASYKKSVLRPLLVVSTILSVLAIIVLVGIMIDKNQKLLLTLILYGGNKNKGYLYGLAYLSILTIISVIIGIFAFLIINVRPLNSSAIYSIVFIILIVLISYFVFFTISYLAKNRALSYKMLRGK